jgi:hypothetical protein
MHVLKRFQAPGHDSRPFREDGGYTYTWKNVDLKNVLQLDIDLLTGGIGHLLYK